MVNKMSEGNLFTAHYGMYNNDANTLHPTDIGTHKDGWTIEGEIHEDYYQWVNDFTAHHLVYGRVWGDFEHVVYADSEDGFNHFIEHHPPEEWNYWDI